MKLARFHPDIWRAHIPWKPHTSPLNNKNLDNRNKCHLCLPHNYIVTTNFILTNHHFLFYSVDHLQTKYILQDKGHRHVRK